jgi:hypothetical protein
LLADKSLQSSDNDLRHDARREELLRLHVPVRDALQIRALDRDDLSARRLTVTSALLRASSRSRSAARFIALFGI